MVLWPGLGRREVRLHTLEEATACSSLNCATRCILFTAPRTCLLFFFWQAAYWLIVRSAVLLLDSRWWSTDIALLCQDAANLSRLWFAAKLPPLFHECVLAPGALLKFFSSSLSAYCETTAGCTTVGHAIIFYVSPGNGRRLDLTSADPIADTISKITARTVGDCSV